MSCTPPAADTDPTCGLLIIGDELLQGSTPERNGPFLLQQLYARGVRVGELRLVGDRVAQIAAALRAMADAWGRVVSTGGIGPTHDDVTLAAVAEACGRRLVPHPARGLWTAADAPDDPGRPLLLPEGALLHHGSSAAVPVVQVANIFVLPGVPSLVRAALAQLDIWGRGRPFVARQVHLAVDELAVASLLARLQADHPQVSVGSYPQPPGRAARVVVHISGRQAEAVAACRDALLQGLTAAQLAVSPSPPEG